MSLREVCGINLYLVEVRRALKPGNARTIVVKFICSDNERALRTPPVLGRPRHNILDTAREKSKGK